MLKINFQQNFEFSKSVERFKSYNFFPSMYKKKVQEWWGCMLARTLLHGDEDMIVRDQSNNYFHLTPKIGPLCPPPPLLAYQALEFQCPKLKVWRRRRRRRKSPFEDPWFHLRGPWVKRGFRGSLKSDFDKTIDQSNVNGFSWIFPLINYLNKLEGMGAYGPLLLAPPEGI